MIPEQHTAEIIQWLNHYASQNRLVPPGYKLKIQLELEEVDVTPRLVDKTEEAFRQTPLEELGLFVRTKTTLNNLGCFTVEDLLNWIATSGKGKPQNLLRVRNMGQKSYSNLKEQLAKIGFSVDSW